MFHEAWCSLKNDKTRSFFYWLTFLVTALFIFLFFSIGMSSDVGVTMFYAKNDIPTNLMLMSVLLCAVEIFFANDFYVRQKAKELSMMLICGAGYPQLAGFLLIQTGFLAITAIAAAVILGMAVLPFMEMVIRLWTGTVFHIQIQAQAVIWMSLLIGYVLLWTVVCNLAFAYRNSAVTLLQTDKKKVNREKLLQFSVKPSLRLRQILSLICMFLPIAGYYRVPDGAILFSVISLVGLDGCIQNIVFPGIEKRIKNRLDDASEVAILGFLRNDLTILKLNIYLLAGCMILLISLLLTASSSLDMVMTMMAYTAMNILLAMSLTFRFSVEIVNRKKAFETLEDLGFTRKQLHGMVRKETGRLFYGMILIILFYLVNMLLSAGISGSLNQIGISFFLVLSAVLPVWICMLLSRHVYKRYTGGKEDGMAENAQIQTADQ